VAGKLKIDLDSLRPTLEDVEAVLKNLSNSAAGPDGISNVFYKNLSAVASDVFLALTNYLIDGARKRQMSLRMGARRFSR